MRITENPGLGQAMTFELSRHLPVHGWFWYKEGFAPQIIEYCLEGYSSRAGGRKPGNILDPFCGVGTTLLSAKDAGILSLGVDASPLAVFVSKTKSDDYGKEHIDAVKGFLERTRTMRDYSGPKWEFELFDPRAAFPKRNLNQILALREAIENEEGRVRNLLLLCLLSVLPQASLVLKDGGVLRINKAKRALPAKEIFKRKMKKMLRDIEFMKTGFSPQVFLGDARALNIPSESVDLVVTSPPYLNNIDYSKVYGLELSLLGMSKSSAEEVRMRAVRSFIRSGDRKPESDMPPEVGEIGSRIPIIGTYFRDMENALSEMHRVMRTGGEADIIVSNSVIHETHVLVDEILAEIGERIGFSDSEIVIGAERIADVRPQKVKTRESIIVLRK